MIRILKLLRLWPPFSGTGDGLSGAGLQYRCSDGRLHYRCTDKRLHYRCSDSLIHYRASDEQ